MMQREASRVPSARIARRSGREGREAGARVAVERLPLDILLPVTRDMAEFECGGRARYREPCAVAGRAAMAE